MLSFVYFLQTNLKQKGYIHLFILTYILLVGFNIFSINEIMINKFSVDIQKVFIE